MNETPMLFPIEPQAFWKQMRRLVEEVVTERSQPPVSKEVHLLPQKPLLKLPEVCIIFQISKPTVYTWIRQKKLNSFKIRGRRYFVREDIEAIVRGQR